MLQDFRYSLRQLRRSPGFTVVVLLTLAVGIGAVTTVVTWANAVMFNPWPQVRDARQLRFVSAVVSAGGGYSQHYNQLEYLRQNARGFSDVTANEMSAFDLAGTGSVPERYWGGVVASNYFQFLGVQPVLGRGFTPHDDRAYGSAPEVVISYALWHSRFHGDPSILGKSIQVDRHPLTVVGIAPTGFEGIYGGLSQSMWVPLSELAELTGRPDPLVAGNFGLQISVRLRPGVSDAQASAELHTLAQQFAKQQNSTYYNQWDLVLNDSAHMSRGIYGDVGDQMPFQAGAAILLLVLICANVAGLLIQRSARRAREVAIRTALGASARRLIQQMFIETAILTVAGGIAGWLVSLGLSRTLYALLPKFGIGFAFNLGTDWRILLFAAGLMGVVVVLCGLLPARQVLRISQAETLHSGSISVLGSRGGLAKRALVSVQLGICFVLLLACGLLVRTLWNVVHRDPGFDTANTLVANVDLTRAGYTQEKGFAFQRALLDKLRGSPELQSASITSYVPMGASGGGNVRDVAVDGYEPAKNESMSVVTDSEGPGFFHAMHISLTRGREFTDQDVASAPCVAMVNEGMAKKYWPKGNALGGRVTVSKHECTVVGIVHDYVYRNVVWESGDPVLYLPILQDYQGWFGIVMRSRTSAYNALPTLQSAVASLDSTLPITDVESLNDHIQVSYSGQKVPAEMIAVYGVCCLLVAMLGVYASMAYSVSERNREFALRMALGAERLQVLSLVMNSGLRVVAGGLAIGTAGAFFAVRVLKAMLYGVSSFDPASSLLAAVLIVLTACAAALLPARRAASIEPMSALRME
ncbi:MAG TPA: ABC transporter permease [Terriglobales bacterium]|nr:ABC transporter permease [Terriglobales bacterium]